MVYYGSRFAPRPRKAAPSGAAARPVRTVGDGQDPDGIVCIRIRPHGWGAARRVQHTVTCYNDRHAEVLLSTDPATERSERSEVLAAMFAQFPGINWDYGHQVLIGPDGVTIHAMPDVLDPGFLPDIDGTFGAPKPPVYAPQPRYDTIPQLPERRAA